MDSYRKHIEETNRLSLPEARGRVLELLMDTSRFTCIPATTPLDSSYDFLAPELHAFFSQFESITTTRLWNAKGTHFDGYRTVHGYINTEELNNEFTFDRAMITPVEGGPVTMGSRNDVWTNWWHIGEAFGWSEYLVVKAGDDSVFEGDNYDGPDTIELIGRTICHWILWFESPS